MAVARRTRGAKLDFGRFYRGTVTETGASTYTETEIDTNLATFGNYLALVHTMDVKAEGAMGVINGAADYLEIVLSRNSQTGIIGPDDADFICGFGFGMFFVTSGGGEFEFVRERLLHHPVPIVKNMYLGVKGTSLASAMTIQFRIGYHLTKGTEADILRIASGDLVL